MTDKQSAISNLIVLSTLLLVILKLTNAITWAWYYVLSPIIVFITLLIIIGVINHIFSLGDLFKRGINE